MAMPPFIDNFVKGPRPPKIVLGVLGLLVILAGGYFVLLSPVQARIGALQARHAALQTELITSRAQVAELARFRRELTELQQRLETLKEKLPSDKETPGLYRGLTEAAQRVGLGVSLFRPAAPQPREYVSEIPISLTAEGNYHQLGEFLERVAALPRVVTLGSFKLTGLKAANSLRAELTLATFMFQSLPAAPSAKPGAPPAGRGRS